MSLLRPAPVSMERFTFHSGILVAEISDLRNISFERVWDDACDVGLTIISHHTRREVVYTAQEQRDREGELTHWVCTPARLQDVGLPIVHIYND